MKKLLLGILVALCSVSCAQDVFYGFKLGNNISNFGGDDNQGFSSKSGLHISGSYRYLGGSGFGFESGIGYSSFGANAVQDTLSLTVNYLDLQYYLRYDIYYGLNLQTVLEMAFKLGAKQGDTKTAYFEDNIKLTDFRFCLGAGYQFQKGFSVDIIYKVGLGTIFEDPEDDYDFNGNIIQAPQLDIRNKSILVSVGYFFN